MTRPDLDALAALIGKATPDAVFAFSADELSALIAYVRELERQRDAVAAAVAAARDAAYAARDAAYAAYAAAYADGVAEQRDRFAAMVNAAFAAIGENDA